MINLIINGQQLAAEEGMTILQAAKRGGIHIPTLCYLENINSIGSCRLCVVEIKGRDDLPTACNTPVKDGMVIHTMSPRVVEARKTMLRLLLADHKQDCSSCPSNGRCELQQLCLDYDITASSLPNTGRLPEVRTDNPFLGYRSDLCVYCQRCINTCAAVSGRKAITTERRGPLTILDAPFGDDWKNTLCESCGNCAEACPTGALYKTGDLKYRAGKPQRVRTTCPHCGVGCQLDLLVHEGKIVCAEGANGPSNGGRLCVKGRFSSYNFVHSGDRLTDPLIKDPVTGEFHKAGWDEALDLVASRFSEIKKNYGADALAGFACSRSSNEDIYMLQKMVRAAFGTNNTDNCARV